MINKITGMLMLVLIVLVATSINPVLAQTLNIKDINISLKSSTTGKPTNLRAYSDGHYTIIVFFSTECPLCNMQLPSVERLHLAINSPDNESLKLPPTRLISIAFDTWGEKSVEPFMKENKYTFDVWYDPMARKTNRNFKVDKDGIPATYIFKPDGSLLKKGVGFIRELDRSTVKLIVDDSK